LRKEEEAVKAVCAAAMEHGIEVLGVENGIGEKIIWKWTNEKKIHKSQAKEVNGKLCFRANRIWIPLDKCMKVS